MVRVGVQREKKKKLTKGTVEPPTRRPSSDARTPEADTRKSPSRSGSTQGRAQYDRGERYSPRNSLDIAEEIMAVSGAEEDPGASLLKENGGGGEEGISTEPVKGISSRKLKIPKRKVRILFLLSKYRGEGCSTCKDCPLV